MSDSENSSPPNVPPDSPGSSVSSRLQGEYDELLKYAVVLPNYDPMQATRTLTNAHLSFPQHNLEQDGRTTQNGPAPSDVDEDPQDVYGAKRVPQTRTNLPNLSQSPISSHAGRKSSLTYDDDVESDLDQPDKSTPRASAQYPRARHVFVRDCQVDCDVENVVYASTIDPDVSKMENILDQWSLDLKRNVLAEFGQAKIRIVERSRNELQRERERFVSDKNQLIGEIDKLTELLHTYETSIERKDQVISNLTSALNKQRDKFELLKKFTEWKLQHNDLNREAFASNLAQRHYERHLSGKVWAGWRSVIETKWSHRVEKACQARAQEVCKTLTNDYEAKIAKLNGALEAAQEKIGRLNVDRERYEEAMKKAFMRGVCALNLEAMTMFHAEDEDQQGQASNGKDHLYPDDLCDNLETLAPEKDYGPPKNMPHDADYSPRGVGCQPPRPAHATGSVGNARLNSRVMTASSATRGKVVTAKVTAKVDTGKSSRGLGSSGQTLAPPMASVIVERHQPITKQTVGKAVASKYPASQTGHIFRRLAGQGSPVTLSPHVHSVKVVD